MLNPGRALEPAADADQSGLAERLLLGHALSSVPRDSDEGRAHLQLRLCMFSRFGTLITLGFGLLGGGLLSLSYLDTGQSWHWQATLGHLSLAVVYGAAWAYTRKRTISTRWLEALDATLMLAASASFIAMGSYVPVGGRPDVLLTFGIGQTLALRAVYLPSTWQRTALISSASVVPVVLFTYYVYSRHPGPIPGAGPLAYAYLSLMLCASVVVIASATSRIIYGLREKVRAARELGQYTLIEKIGEGGMGVVYRAQHAMLRRATAVKLLPPERAGQMNLARFEREARLTSVLTHPNTVSVYDFGRTPDGLFYYAMEYLDGLDLDALFRYDGPQPPARVVHLLAQICGALGEAHSIGLIHRDIKPHNVFICERAGLSDVVKVLDFGLVKALTMPADTELSTTNQILGTPLYMSPEAIVSPDHVDARSDLYAVGAIGYCLLAGAPPFGGQTMVEVCGHHLHSQPVAPSQRLAETAVATAPESFAALDRVLLRCLEKRPEARPKDAATLRAELLAVPLAAPWTELAARNWWSERSASVRARARAEAPRAETSSARGHTRTFAIDLTERAQDLQQRA